MTGGPLAATGGAVLVVVDVAAVPPAVVGWGRAVCALGTVVVAPGRGGASGRGVPPAARPAPRPRHPARAPRRYQDEGGRDPDGHLERAPVWRPLVWRRVRGRGRRGRGRGRIRSRGCRRGGGRPRGGPPGG